MGSDTNLPKKRSLRAILYFVSLNLLIPQLGSPHSSAIPEQKLFEFLPFCAPKEEHGNRQQLLNARAHALFNLFVGREDAVEDADFLPPPSIFLEVALNHCQF